MTGTQISHPEQWGSVLLSLFGEESGQSWKLYIAGAKRTFSGALCAFDNWVWNQHHLSKLDPRAHLQQVHHEEFLLKSALYFWLQVSNVRNCECWISKNQHQFNASEPTHTDNSIVETSTSVSKMFCFLDLTNHYNRHAWAR